MAKRIQKRASSTVNPGGGTSAKKETTKKDKPKKERTPAARWRKTVEIADGDSLEKGERCNGVEWPLPGAQKEALQFRMQDYAVLEGRAKFRFNQKQFLLPSMYNLYMADKYSYLSAQYKAVAEELVANPETDVWESSAQRNKEKALLLAAENKVLETRTAVMEELFTAMSSGADGTDLQAEVQRCTWDNVYAAFGGEEDRNSALETIAGATVQQIRAALS